MFLVGQRMPAEKSNMKTSENRRATKPIMEKRRRARINQCLSELKTLILDALNKDPSRHSKLEKADILEMTVRYLQNVQRQQMAAAISTDPTVLNKFRAGFNECATEVSRYVSRIEGVDPALRQRLLNHLSHCLNGLNSTPPFSTQGAGTMAFPGMSPQFSNVLNPLQSLSLQIPAGVPAYLNRSDVNNNSTNSTLSPSSSSKLFNGLPLIPTRLPNGDFAFLLPSQSLSTSSDQLSNTEPSQLGSWSSSVLTSPTASASPDLSDGSALSPTGSESSDLNPPTTQEPPHRSSSTFEPRNEVCKESTTPRKDSNENGQDNENVWRPW
ncbi:transcription factor HES-1-like [Centruroides vittatus]|uniref:transcription factor HES-1-like n=1 Tax=Centruroides vittatus TaxID=120091 RepID=UPI00351075B6